ncbi:MAG: UDP-glucose 4-epimerase GalE [Rhodospirillales bacterium]|nr:UDP-glucose 4-epimerase GalE [Rhodospirillales bacterium]
MGLQASIGPVTGASVLVTGGAGFVGAHVCRALAGAGFVPVAYDDLSAGHREFAKWGPFVRAKIEDAAALDAAIAAHGVVACVHLAGSIEVGLSVREPVRFWQNNVSGTLVLLDRLRAAKVGAFVFSSTAAVYGEPETVPMAESHPKRPTNPYGETKLAVEAVLAAEARSRGLAWIAFRYFNAAGSAWADGIGEDHSPESHLIPLACQAAMGTRPPLTIFGDDYPTPDGTALRDYIHVVDLGAAHVLGIRRALAGRIGAPFNLGTGTGYSVRQVVDTVGRIAGRPVPHSFGARRAGDSPALVADPSSAMRELGWQPKSSALDTIVADAWAWHSRRHTPKA